MWDQTSVGPSGYKMLRENGLNNYGSFFLSTGRVIYSLWLLTVNVMWLAASHYHNLDFDAVMDSNVQLWVKMKPKLNFWQTILSEQKSN